jgi:hypothetical protein
MPWYVGVIIPSRKKRVFMVYLGMPLFMGIKLPYREEEFIKNS